MILFLYMKNVIFNAETDNAKIINRKKAIQISGGSKIFEIICYKYNLEPFYKAHKMTLYWREDIDRALIFFKNGMSAPVSTPPLSGC